MPGDGNMKISDELEQKILKSGIFKFEDESKEDKSKPVGIIKIHLLSERSFRLEKIYDKEEYPELAKRWDISEDEVKEKVKKEEKKNTFDLILVFYTF